MTLSIKVIGEQNTEKVIVVENLPDTCPVCHHGMDPRFIYGYRHDDGSRVQHVFQCPRMDCHSMFIASYVIQVDGIYCLQRLEPTTFQARKFDDPIVLISEDFTKIYNQAQQSEMLGMLEIAGPGYRKSLEFLMKDYAILRNPEASDNIKRILLSNVINDYVTDARIKSTAKRAAWLGNDETHYYRKWADKDIRDLKILIELTVRWIESEELTRKYESDMTV
jgi:hypothetical protein